MNALFLYGSYFQEGSYLDVCFQQFPNKTPIVHFDSPMKGVRQKATVAAELLIPRL